MIEQQNVTAGTCGECGDVDYAPTQDDLPGYAIEVSHGGMIERGYACRLTHVGRVTRALGDKLPDGKEWPSGG